MVVLQYIFIDQYLCITFEILYTVFNTNFQIFSSAEKPAADDEGAAAYVWLFGKLKFKFFHCQTKPNAKRGFGLNAPRHLSA